MPQIPVKPIVMRDCVLKIAADNYEKHVSGVSFDPSTGTVTWNGLTPDASFTFPTASTWGAKLDYAQDWETPDSLSIYLYEHEGEQVDMTFEPKAGGLGWKVTVFIAPGSIGGQVNSVATASVSLGVLGKPIPVPAPVPGP